MNTNPACPFRIGDAVIFTPSERTVGLYQNIERFGVKVNEVRIVTEIRNDKYLYFDDGDGGWAWSEFAAA